MAKVRHSSGSLPDCHVAKQQRLRRELAMGLAPVRQSPKILSAVRTNVKRLAGSRTTAKSCMDWCINGRVAFFRRCSWSWLAPCFCGAIPSWHSSTLIPVPMVFIGSWIFWRKVYPRYYRLWDASSRQISILGGMLQGDPCSQSVCPGRLGV